MAETSRTTAGQIDRAAAETLIRSSVLAMANGASIRDLDEVVRRNAGRVSHSDIMAGRLGSDVLGDIIGTVEQAKGNTAFNWNAATPEQIKAYLVANGFNFTDHGRNGLALAGGGKENGQTSREATASETGFSGITQHNFAGTSFHAAGLSWGAFAELRQQGFDGNQIIAAVNTNKRLGLGANDNAAATARLLRDVPSAISGLHTTRDNWKHVHDLEAAEREARERGQTAKANQIKEKIEAARKQAEEHDRREQDRVRQEKPERVPDLIDRQQAIQRATEQNIRDLTLGKDAKATTNDALQSKAEIGATTAIIDRYIRHSEDAKARRDYAALKQQVSGDKTKSNAVAALTRNVKRDADLRTAEKDNNEFKDVRNGEKASRNAEQASKNIEQTKAGDANLDFLNETPTKPKARAADADDKANVAKPTQETKTKPRSQSGNTKLTQAKTLAPTA